MMKRGVRTFGNLADGRRARTPHGAYLELAALSLQRRRLLQERANAEKRSHEIDRQLIDMDARTAGLLRYIENPKPLRSRRARRRAEADEHGKGTIQAQVIRERELRY